MGEVSTIGLDIAKSIFQIHGVDADGAVVIRKRISRAKEFFATLPACLVGIEACPTAHHWSRRLQALGHTVKLMPPSYVKAYLKRSKNDANDAAAICEAVTRPSMRFVATKSEQQQSGLMLHRSRQLLVCQRTMLSNAIRGHMAELGIISAKGRKLFDARWACGLCGLREAVGGDGQACIAGLPAACRGRSRSYLRDRGGDGRCDRLQIHHRAADQGRARGAHSDPRAAAVTPRLCRQNRQIRNAADGRRGRAVRRGSTPQAGPCWLFDASTLTFSPPGTPVCFAAPGFCRRPLPQTCPKQVGIRLMFVVNPRYHPIECDSCLTSPCRAPANLGNRCSTVASRRSSSRCPRSSTNPR